MTMIQGVQNQVIVCIILLFSSFSIVLRTEAQGEPPVHPPPPPAEPIPPEATTPRTPPTPPPPPPYRTDKPAKKEWGIADDPAKKEKLLMWLIDGCYKTDSNSPNCPEVKLQPRPVEYEGYDGFYNNLAHPDLGAIDTPLLRRWPAAYEDGVYEPSGSDRPEPLELSEQLLSGKIGTKSETGKTALLVFFGQQVVEEILDAQRPACPPEYFNIKIPEDHPYRLNKPNHTEIPVLRTRFDMRTGFSPNNPRQQLNEITPWLDGGLMYGTTKTWSDHLRMYENGTSDPHGLLASSHDGLFPEYNTIRLPMANPPPPFYHSTFVQNHKTLEVSRFFKLGNPRGNENPFLLTFGVLWFRWHNHIARYLHKTHPTWTSDQVFNEARKWVIATQQHIVVNEWLPEWLGEKLDKYSGYDPSIDPQIDQFFQAAAFRFGHTLVPPGVYVRDYGSKGCNLIKDLNGNEQTKANLNNGTIRTCNSFWRPQDFIQAKLKNNEFVDIDRLLMGMAFQLCEKEDNIIVEDLRGRVFGPLEFSRRDLMALNIQRGRDHGLPDYNSARKAFGLKVNNNMNNVIKDPKILEAFNRLHENRSDNIDVWVGGILETDRGPGELFTKIIKDQFTRIRNGDRFWYRNTGNGLFTKSEIDRLEKLTMYDIILSVTKMNHDDIQDNPFAAPSLRNGYNELNANCSKMLDKYPCQKKYEESGTDCYHLKQIDETNVEQCTDPETYDYFSGSEVSFILTFFGVGLIILGFVGILFLLVKQNNKKYQKRMQRIAGRVGASESFRKGKKHLNPYSVSEWVDRKSPLRPVVVLLDAELKKVEVKNQLGHLLRAMDLTHNQIIEVYNITDGQHLMLRVSNDYDLVLKFESEYLHEKFLEGLETFIQQVGITRQRINLTLNAALRQAVTRQDRQKRLEMFFRVVFSQAFNISHSEVEILKLDSQVAREIIYTELTMSEFAEALSMPAESEFVRKMFDLVDKDKNGFISFREFVDMLIIFAKGTADDKAKLMFDIYDINATGELTKEDFKNMIMSLMETVSADVEQHKLETAITTMLRAARLENKEHITLQDFQRLLNNNKGNLGIDQLNFTGIPTPQQPASKILPKRSSFVECARLTAFSIYSDPRELRAETGAASTSQENETRNDPIVDSQQAVALENKPADSTKNPFWVQTKRLIENYSREIFWLTLYTLVLLAIFAERAYYYSVEREHSGLRRIAGYGVTVTRGAASAMMFTYSTLLITMCRNTITMLRDTFLHIYIPFDSAVSFHKYVAVWALVFTIMHCIGHGFNFYSISTQTSDDLTCLFRNFFHSTHEIPKFHYWCWETITGVTGILLTLLTALIFIFALPYARTKLYNAFWFTHSLYKVFYLLMILHGAGRLIQPPFFYYFFLGPCILFTLDRLVTTTRKKVEIPVIKAELLPSNVTYLEFKKPSNFEYKSGQWVRIACTALNRSEYHPFTLSSAPHEKNLTVHIRAVGPWTTNIRSIYDPTLLRDKPLPKIHLDGSYGEGHQDWYQFDVAILVGGGIGVTPFASILKDIVFKSKVRHQASCRKVYFVWVTKTQKHFEWLVDILREVENDDTGKVVSVHIFITQFYQKFDLRTILLYICERHFQKLSNRSLFTGLKAITHFGRPNFTQFFKSVQTVNQNVRKVGVFSCGPPPMTQNVDKVCLGLNKETGNGPIFQHHFKNF